MGVKSEWPTITVVTAFFVVADRSHHGYASPSSNKKVFCQQKLKEVPIAQDAELAKYAHSD